MSDLDRQIELLRNCQIIKVSRKLYYARRATFMLPICCVTASPTIALDSFSFACCLLPAIYRRSMR